MRDQHIHTTDDPNRDNQTRERKPFVKPQISTEAELITETGFTIPSPS